MAIESPVTYSNLESNEIRLVRIKLGADGQLSCTLSTNQLDDSKVAYHALSYVWGDATDQEIISCDGRSLPITRNLHAALCQLRSKGYDWLLWIDAICINQQDNVEKTAQVQLMHTIFTKADMVLIWLGEALPTDGAGLELMCKVREVMLELEKQEGVFNHELDLEEMDLPAMDDSAWGTVAEIMKRPWFHRIWIVQELLCSCESVMLCGDREISTALILGFAGKYICMLIRLPFPRSPVQYRSLDDCTTWLRLFLDCL